jgi:hypothetical protein
MANSMLMPITTAAILEYQPKISSRGATTSPT